jgi:cell division protein FtsX
MTFDWQMDDWQFWALTGGSAAALVMLSYWADHKRVRRTVPDAVGWMPWTGLYFVSLLVACVSLGVAAREWFHG